MSVVVRMEMPKRCYECDMADGITCMATGGVYGREVPKMTWIRRRPDWCPIICSLPEGHGRLVDAEILRAKLIEHIAETNGFGNAFNETPTIVPAEAQRKVDAPDDVTPTDTPTDTPTVPAERSE